AVLNEVAGRVRGGRPVVQGELITFPDWSHRVHALPLVNPAEVLYAANRFFGRPDHDSVPGLQLVWDDKAGRFPWEPDYSVPRGLRPLPGRFHAGPASAWPGWCGPRLAPGSGSLAPGPWLRWSGLAGSARGGGLAAWRGRRAVGW